MESDVKDDQPLITSGSGFNAERRFAKPILDPNYWDYFWLPKGASPQCPWNSHELVCAGRRSAYEVAPAFGK